LLSYFREWQEARQATLGRRIYGYASSAVLLAVGVWVFLALAPVWIFWATFAATFLLDAFLTRKWVNEDPLRNYRAGEVL